MCNLHEFLLLCRMDGEIKEAPRMRRCIWRTPLRGFRFQFVGETQALSPGWLIYAAIRLETMPSARPLTSAPAPNHAAF